MTNERRTDDPREDLTVTHSGPPSRRALREASIGHQLGKYQITGVLGVGGMGVVFRAVDGDLQRAVALKVLSPERHDGGEATRQESARLLREARAQAQLSHPNVVEIYDVGCDGGEVYLAMELVEGQSLRAWLDAGPHGVREVLPLFLAAGEGLHAAHRAGLVHRDFKPANVLIGRDGRPRVSDFGLARPSRDPSHVSTPRSGEVPTLDDETLTVDGAIVGTPAYMAPEQQAGEALTPAVDQYAFCMTLWEALAGRHPLRGLGRELGRGLGLRELLEAKRRWVPTPPDDVDAPSGLWRTLARGLALAPADRFPGMDALLEALRREGASRRSPWIGAIAASLLATGVAVGLWLPTETPAPCRIDEAALVGHWDSAARGAVQAAFEATGRSYAAEAFERTARSLDEYGAAWLAQRRTACEATHVHGEQDEATLDRRVACLDEAGDALRRVVEVLRETDATTVDRTPAVLALLPELARCEDVASLAAHRSLGPTREAQAQALALGGELVSVRARVSAGRFAQALAQADELRARVEALGDARLTAKHAIIRADALKGLARPDESYAELQRALMAAGEAGEDRLAARVAVRIAWNLGRDQSRPREGLDWLRTAEASLARVGDDPALLADVLGARGVLEMKLDHHEAAEDALTRAIALVEERLGSEEARLAELLGNLAILEIERGEHVVAEGLLRRALSLQERAHGRDHPETVIVLHNLATIFIQLDRNDEALVANAEALARIGRTYGPEHPLVAALRVTRASLLSKQGQRGLAAIELRAASETYEKTLGPDHHDLVIIHDKLGRVLLEDGQLDEARQATERSLSVARANGLYETSMTTPSLVTMAQVLTKLRQDELARVRWDEVLARIDGGHTEGNDLPPLYRSAATAYARVGEIERAAALQARADALEAQTPQASEGP